MPLDSAPDISNQEWAAVQDLLRDLQSEEGREHLAYLYGQWRLSIKAFRRVEARRMTSMEPTSTDILFHKASVTDLLSFGTLIQIAAQEHTDAELATYGVRPGVIGAILRDLHNTFDEWHAQVPQARLDRLSASIFDAAPELNLENPRA